LRIRAMQSRTRSSTASGDMPARIPPFAAASSISR
jgi:hypothetical protein